MSDVLVGEERALELLEDALCGSAADETEIVLATRRSSVLRFAGELVHQPQDLASLQLMVRAVVGARSARAATSSPDALGEAVRRAEHDAADLDRASRRRPTHGAAAAAHLPAGPGSRSPLPARAVVRVHSAVVGGRTRSPARLAAPPRPRGSGRRAERTGGNAGRRDHRARRRHLARARRYGTATEASFSCTACCADGSAHAEELDRDAAAFDVERIAAALLEQAAAMRGAVELPPGRYDVVFGPQAAAELITFLPAFGFTAPALAAGVGVVAARARRFSPLVSVVDDATAAPGLPFPFDWEGSDTRRVELVRAGLPLGVVSDLASAAVTGGSTGHAHIAREEAPTPRRRACASSRVGSRAMSSSPVSSTGCTCSGCGTHGSSTRHEA